MEEVVSPENYGKALQAVIANQGAPGIDGMKTEELNGHLLKHWPKIQAKLRAGTYTPSPVRRVEIPKPNGGKRMLGVPTVLDRFIQQLLLLAMTPIWEPRFSEHSYGFRPGRKAADAVRGFGRRRGTEAARSLEKRRNVVAFSAGARSGPEGVPGARRG